MSTNSGISGFAPTAEQQAIIDATKQSKLSIMVEADAGCTKTSTLEMLARRMQSIPSLAIAFNKKTATELQQRLPPHFQVKTMNGLGYGAWQRKVGGKLRLSEYKIGDLIKSVSKEFDAKLSTDDWSTVKDLVNGARQAGLIHKNYAQEYEGLIEDTTDNWVEISEQIEPRFDLIGIAREVLRESTAQALLGEVDFDDMVYCSVLMGGQYAQFPLVVIDEAQDLNPLNHLQVQKSARDRLIVMGDQKQGIYAFRGASHDSIARLRMLRKEWIDLPLHTTFRCPKVVVARQQQHAPGYAAAEHNAEGEFYRWISSDGAKALGQSGLEFNGLKSDTWSYKWLQSLRKPGEKIVIACRNNAPLMGIAFRLIRQGIMPEMLGRDIGKGLIALSKKISPAEAELLPRFAEKVREWQREETRKAKEFNKDHLIAGVIDRAECLIAVAETAKATNVGELRKAIAELFARSNGEVTLGTGHRLKGLEFSIVVHLDPWRIPSRYALLAAEEGDERQLQQEKNLRYVVETRTKRVLVEANLGDFE